MWIFRSLGWCCLCCGVLIVNVYTYYFLNSLASNPRFYILKDLLISPISIIDFLLFSMFLYNEKYCFFFQCSIYVKFPFFYLFVYFIKFRSNLKWTFSFGLFFMNLSILWTIAIKTETSVDPLTVVYV